MLQSLIMLQCDEGQPTCQRCSKSGFPCVYRDEFDLFLRNQTNKTAEAAQKKWRSRSKKSPAESFTEVSSSSPESARERSIETSPSALPQDVHTISSLQDLAFARFVFDYVITPTPYTSYASFYDFVPKLCLNADKKSSAFAALSATALANFAGRCRSEEAKRRSVEEYGRAIQLLKTTMSSEDPKSCLELLATSSLLGTYELITAPYLTRGGSWSAHINGSVAILNRNFSNDQMTNDVGGILASIVSQMLIIRMSSGQRPTIPIELCNNFISNRDAPPNMLYGMMYETAHFIADWNERKIDCDIKTLLCFGREQIKEGQKLDTRLVEWMESRPEPWDVQKLDNCEKIVPIWLRGLYASKGAPRTLHMYTAFHIAHRWAFWRSTRITLHGVLLDMTVLQTANATTTEERDSYLSIEQVLQIRMYELVDDLCQSIFASFVVPIAGKPDPTSIDDVAGIRAHAILWPLYRAGMTLKRNSMRRLDSHQRFEWVRSALEFLNAEMGVAKAKAFFDNLDGLYDDSYNWP